jgi:hypothetical protein
MGIKSVSPGVLWDVAIATGCSKSNPRPVRPLSVVRRSVPYHAKSCREDHLPRWEMICTFPDTGGRFRRNHDANASDAHALWLTVAGNAQGRHPQRPQDQMPAIRHDAIALNTHKNFGLSFCQDFFERSIVSIISENPIPAISMFEYVKDHFPRRLACYSWHANKNLPRKRSSSTMIGTHPIASTRPSCLCFPGCVSWEYQGHPQGKCAENQS